MGLAKWVDNVVSGTIGWKTALEALIALKAIDMLMPMAVQFGLIALALSNIVGLVPRLRRCSAPAAFSRRAVRWPRRSIRKG